MIVDSDVLINASRGQAAALDFLIQSGESDTLFITAISYIELLSGARDKTEQRRVEKFLGRFELIALDHSMSLRAIELVRQYRLSHGLGLPDAFIAAAALDRNDVLATSNTRDFVFIKDLRLKAP